jgi:transcriptional regulator with XRE-family HTH domain
MTPTEFKKARQTLGLSQRDLAARIGYADKAGRNNILDFESGRREVPPWIAQLVRYYVLDIEDESPIGRRARKLAEAASRGEI